MARKLRGRKAVSLRKEHKSKKGGLTEKGRKYYNSKTGSNLKRPQPDRDWETAFLPRSFRAMR